MSLNPIGSFDQPLPLLARNIGSNRRELVSDQKHFSPMRSQFRDAPDHAKPAAFDAQDWSVDVETVFLAFIDYQIAVPIKRIALHDPRPPKDPPMSRL